MNSEEATKAICTSEAAQTLAARALAEAKTRLEIGAARVETTRQELTQAHEALANEPGPASTKRASQARTALLDAEAVRDILLVNVGRAELAVEVAAAAVKSARDALAKAERDVDMAEGGQNPSRPDRSLCSDPRAPREARRAGGEALSHDARRFVRRGSGRSEK